MVKKVTIIHLNKPIEPCCDNSRQSCRSDLAVQCRFLFSSCSYFFLQQQNSTLCYPILFIEQQIIGLIFNLTILLDTGYWFAEFYFWAIVNPCMYNIAQCRKVGKDVFIWVSHAFGHYIRLFIIEGMQQIFYVEPNYFTIYVATIYKTGCHVCLLFLCFSGRQKL